VFRRKASASSENQIVRFLEERFGGRRASLEMGIGDDAAVFRPPGAEERWVVTTDMLLEGVDFRADWQTPEQLGWKALAENLSDLAAMGVRPRFYTVALAIPSAIGESWIAAFYQGLTSLAKIHGAILIGGDLSRSLHGVQVCIAALGETLRRKILYRAGGKAGDGIYVTGSLGRSAAGLFLLEQGCTEGATLAERLALEAHRRPRPRCREGLWLAQQSLAGGMIDVSDGLSMDLHRLCRASGAGAEICLSRLPRFEASGSWGCDPLELALHGGEDFELLFSIPAGKTARFEASYPRRLEPCTQIGRLTRHPGVYCVDGRGGRRRRVAERGFDHFRS
jgi:thiamine-monophosphate kinase